MYWEGSLTMFQYLCGEDLTNIELPDICYVGLSKWFVAKTINQVKATNFSSKHLLFCFLSCLFYAKTIIWMTLYEIFSHCTIVLVWLNFSCLAWLL